MKKIFITISVLLLLAVSAGAADIHDLIDLAKENSNKYQSIELSHRKNLLNQSLSDSTGSSFELSIGNMPDGGTVLEEEKAYIPAVEASVTLPERIDGLTVSANASIERQLLSDWKNSGAVGTTVSYSKTISSSGSEYEDISSRKLELQTAANYRKDVLNFENSLIQDVYTIMSNEQQVEKAQKKYESSVKSFNNSLKLNEINENSVEYLRKKLDLDKEKLDLDTSILGLNDKKNQFKHTYGIEFEDVTCPEEPVLDFEISESGNTEVYLSYLSMLSAEDKLNSAIGKSSSLSLGGSLSPQLKFSEGESTSAEISAAGKVTLVSGQFNLTGTVSSDYKSDKWSSPKLTISGGWGTGRSSDISEDTLNIEYIQAQSTYNDALYSYNTEAKSLLQEIENHKTESKTIELYIDYYTRILEAKQKLYDLGLCVYSDVENAQADVDSYVLQKTICALKGIVLANKIEIIEL